MVQNCRLLTGDHQAPSARHGKRNFPIATAETEFQERQLVCDRRSFKKKIALHRSHFSEKVPQLCKIHVSHNLFTQDMLSISINAASKELDICAR